MRRSDALTPKTLAELLALPSNQLERVDVALMNLLCAEGLPGSESLDIPTVLATLDAWAEGVSLETARSYPQFLRNPADYENSEGYFKRWYSSRRSNATWACTTTWSERTSPISATPRISSSTAW